MKKIITIVLSLIMIISLAVPTFAEPQAVEATEINLISKKENGLEEAIKAVKRKIDIPEETLFENYSVYNQNGENIWYLHWRDNESDISLSVNITDKGKITSYNYYKPYNYSEMSFPQVTEEQALEKAKDFIRLVAPEGALSKVQKQDNIQNPLTNYFYYFNFYRSIEGVPYYNNNINISVNSKTGEIYNYNNNMEDDLVFPDSKQVISLNAGEKAYANELGLKLIYQYNYDYKNKKLIIYPTYSPKFNNNTYAIHAMTGAKIRTSYPYTGRYDSEYSMDNMKEEAQMAAGGAREPELTKEEIDAAKEQSILLSEKDAEKIARDLTEMSLDQDFTLRNWNLNKNWPIQDEYIYNLNFIKEIKESVKTEEAVTSFPETLRARITINAKTGEVLSFNTNYPYNDEDPIFDEDSSKTAVEEFLVGFIGDRFEQVEYQDPKDSEFYYQEDDQKEPQKYFTFSYTRKVNDTLFPGNTINVGFDAVNGKVTNFNMTWFNVDFPGIENIISMEDANRALFEKAGLELQYKKINKNDEIIPIPMPMPKVDVVKDIIEENPKADESTLILVYVLKAGKSYTLDANTGDLLDYNGKPIKDEVIPEYTDLSGHFSEKQVMQLAKYGIINFKGPEFKPRDEITQKDFMMILSKIVNRHYIPFLNQDSTQEDIDEMYKLLIREGILKDGEKAPLATVLREDAVKFIIRVLKYDKIADIEGIFNVSFKDKDEISPGLEGYIAIASGLNIISGANGNFNPQKTLTRGEAAVMIYNCLAD